MTRPAFIATCASAAAAAALALAVGFAGDTPAAADDAEAPRVCWWSDYANAKLSNRCVYDEDGDRWLMVVGGEFVDARTQRLPVANLCHYFHGTDCP